MEEAVESFPIQQLRASMRARRSSIGSSEGSSINDSVIRVDVSLNVNFCFLLMYLMPSLTLPWTEHGYKGPILINRWIYTKRKQILRLFLNHSRRSKLFISSKFSVILYQYKIRQTRQTACLSR